MRYYESIIITNPNLENDAVEGILSNIDKNLKKNNGEVLNIERWGKKKLAYDIQKFKNGYYTLLHLKADIKAVNELEKMYLISEDIIKHIIVSIDEKKATTKVTQKD